MLAERRFFPKEWFKYLLLGRWQAIRALNAQERNYWQVYTDEILNRLGLTADALPPAALVIPIASGGRTAEGEGDTQIIEKEKTIMIDIPTHLGAGMCRLDSEHGQLSASKCIEVTVGPKRADFVGNDHLALQGAADYVTRLGGGTVRILAGTYEMGNSLFLRDGLHLIGAGDDTVLRKCPSAATRLVEETDWCYNEVFVKDPSVFRVGGGLLLRGTGPLYGEPLFVKRTVVAIEGNVIYLDKEPRENFWLETKPEAATLFPVITGNYVNDVTIENLAIDGNRAENENLNGNYGGGIFIQDCDRIVIRNVTARDYNGDGISWQVCDDMTVDNCRMVNNSDHGLHTGSGSQRTIITNNTIIGGKIELFFCWHVQHGIAENNIIEDASGAGISIGHRDTDNLVRNNQIRRSGTNGVVFRDHPNPARDPHRNTFEGNLIADSGKKGDCIAIEMRGTAEDVILRNNRIVDTRRRHKSRKRIGLRIGTHIKNLRLENNTFERMEHDIVDQRS